MKRRLCLVLWMLLTASPVLAQPSTTTGASLTSTTCPGTGCVTLTVSGFGAVSVQLTGTFTGTWTTEGSVDGSTFDAVLAFPSNSQTPVTTGTATGTWTIGVGGLAGVRVRFTAYTSGTANVTIRSATTSAKVGAGASGTCGSDTQVCFNDGGTISGNAAFLFAKANGTVTINSVAEPQLKLGIQSDAGAKYVTLGASGGDFAATAGTGSSYLFIGSANWGVEADKLLSDTSITATTNGIINGTLAVGTGALSVNAFQTEVDAVFTTAISSASTIAANLFTTTTTNTDVGHLISLNNYTTMGSGGATAQGDVVGLSNSLIIQGIGAVSAQGIGQLNYLRVDIGTGYTQSLAPVPLATAWNANLFGPIGLQPSLFDAANIFIGNYYNGSPSTGKSAGLWVETAPGTVGDGIDATHAAATTYKVDVGIGIVGNSSASGQGFTTALQIGGSGGPWVPTGNSLIGTGISIQDIVTTILSGKGTEGANAVVTLAADEADDATDTWTLQVAASGNAFSFINNSNTYFSLSTAGALTGLTSLTSTAGVFTTLSQGGNAIGLSGALTTAAAVTTSGAFALTLTQTAATSVTMPTTGTVQSTLSATHPAEVLSNSTTNDQDFTSIYSIASGTIVAGRVLRVTLVTSAVSDGAASTILLYLKLGSTKVYTQAAAGAQGNSITRGNTFVFYIHGTAAAGASVNVDTGMQQGGSSWTSPANFANSTNQPVALATNGALTIVPGMAWSTNTGGESLTLLDAVVELVI